MTRRMKVLLFIVLALGQAGPLLASSSLYDAFKTTDETYSEPAASVCVGPVGPAYPCDGDAKARQVKVILDALRQRAQQFRSNFFSTNACEQSPENNRNLAFADEFAEMLEDITSLENRIKAEVAADETIPESRSKTVLKRRIAEATRDHIMAEKFVDNGDARYLGNCVHIARSAFTELREDLADVPGLTLGIWEFADYKEAWYRGMRDPNYHAFVMINCNDDYYIFDGWRGAGEVHGPFLFDPKTQMLSPAAGSGGLDPYFDKPVSPWLLLTNR